MEKREIEKEGAGPLLTLYGVLTIESLSMGRGSSNENLDDVGPQACKVPSTSQTDEAATSTYSHTDQKSEPFGIHSHGKRNRIMALRKESTKTPPLWRISYLMVLHLSL